MPPAIDQVPDLLLKRTGVNSDKLGEEKAARFNSHPAITNAYNSGFTARRHPYARFFVTASPDRDPCAPTRFPKNLRGKSSHERRTFSATRENAAPSERLSHSGCCILAPLHPNSGTSRLR